ncbi:MAG: hypothetical protein GXO39_09860 [Thermotogae bacterium]|nr:hypothetical protein [Thermotogota bacterium]
MLWIFFAQMVDSLEVKPIRLRVFNLSQNEYVQETVKVEVLTFAPNGSSLVVDTIILPNGTLLYEPPAFHIVSFNVFYAGEVFPSNVFVVGKDTSADLYVYDVKDDSTSLKLLYENIGILRDRGGYRVVEVFSVLNASKYAYRGPYLRLKIPKAATGLTLTTGEEDLLRQGDEVVLTPLILPGEGTFALSYLVTQDGFTIEREGAGNYKLLADTLTPVRVEVGVYRGVDEFEGEKIRVWESNNRIAFIVGITRGRRELIYYAVALGVVVVLAVFFGLIDKSLPRK